MPLYEYACQACAERTEEIRDVSARDLEARCECGGLLVRAMSTGVKVRMGRSLPTSMANVGGEHTFRPEHRIPLPSWAQHLTPDQYERAQERACRRAEEKNRAMPVNTDEGDHAGRIPAAEFFARYREAGHEGAHDIDYWKKKGRVFEKHRKRIKKPQ